MTHSSKILMYLVEKLVFRAQNTPPIRYFILVINIRSVLILQYLCDPQLQKFATRSPIFRGPELSSENTDR